ncbi:MAG: hypothetical protein H7Y00_04925 [Fimbriimonadaceae bacterium]|nr:hypothetical protein [Chitinophagales bacterium]
MSVKTTHTINNTAYFITFTCFSWLPLFEITKLYDDIYKGLDVIKKSGNSILGYVIMHNHLHILIYQQQQNITINAIIKECKRFRAYEIVKRLEQMNMIRMLKKLESGIHAEQRNKGAKHKVFEESFDCKECYSTKFIQQKLNYIHQNPVKAGLTIAAEEYLHSSAKYYLTGEQGIYPVTHYLNYYDVPIAR